MKTTGSTCATGAMLMFVGLTLLLLPETALAGDPAWRPTYDIALRWINFIILVGVIVKYAREPIKDFLKLRKREVVAQIDELDTEKSRILGEIQAARQKGDANRARFEEMKQRLIAQGEARKQQIVKQAKQQSEIMLEETRRKMENRIVQAKAGLTSELLDMAIEQAMKQLPELITVDDNHRMLDEYMQSIGT